MTNEDIWMIYNQLETLIYEKKTDEAIEELLGNLNHEDFLKVPIVFELIADNRINLIKNLYKKKIPLSFVDKDKRTPLHVACGANGCLEIVEFLIKNKICTNIYAESMPYGDTPLTLVLAYEHNEILKFFKENFNIKYINIEDVLLIIDRIKTLFGSAYNRKNK